MASNSPRVTTRGKITQFTTPKGYFRFPNLIHPSAFNEGDDPEYSVGLILEGEAAEEFKTVLMEFMDPLIEEYRAKNPKRFSKYDSHYPFKPEEDEDGEETGRTIFNFKSKAFFKNRKGQEVKRFITLFDAKTNKIPHGSINPWGGTYGRLMVTSDGWTWDNAGAKLIGVKCYLNAAQIIKLVEGGEMSADSAGFDEEEGDDLSDREVNEEGFGPEDEDEGEDYGGSPDF